MRAAIASALTRHELELTEPAIARVERWAQEVQKHAKRSNLIGTSENDRIAEELIADSLQLLHVLPSAPVHMIDVGSGAGVPGLILHGALADAQVRTSTLIEPRGKRAMFLRHASRAMGLSDQIQVIAERLEDASLDQRASDTPVLWVSRAVFAPEKWLEVVASYARPQDLCAVWCNGHDLGTTWADPLSTWRLESERAYHVQGPGDRTVFLFRWTSAAT